MRARVQRPHLLRLLDLVRAASESEAGAALPLYTYVRVEADAIGRLRAAAMSGEGAAKASVPATITEPGTCAVPIRRLHDAAKLLADGDGIDIARDGARLVVVAADGSVKLPIISEDADRILDPWTFEVPASAATVSVDAKALAGALAAVRHATSRDEGRQAMRGVCVDARPGEGIHVVGTDGSRIAVATIDGHADRQAAIILSPIGIDCVLEALDGQVGPVQLDLDSTFLLIEGDTVSVRAAGVAAAFPPWEGALKTLTPGASARVAGRRLGDLLRRAVSIAGPTAPARLTFLADRVTVEAESQDGLADGWTPAHDRTGAPQATLKINPRLGIDALDACGDADVTVAIAEAGGAPRALDVRPAAAPGRPRCLVMMIA